MPKARAATRGLSRGDVERLVKVETDVSYLREKHDELLAEQRLTNSNLKTLNEAHAAALSREQTTNRFWGIAAGILGGLIPGFIKH